MQLDFRLQNICEIQYNAHIKQRDSPNYIVKAGINPYIGNWIKNTTKYVNKNVRLLRK